MPKKLIFLLRTSATCFLAKEVRRAETGIDGVSRVERNADVSLNKISGSNKIGEGIFESRKYGWCASGCRARDVSEINEMTCTLRDWLFEADQKRLPGSVRGGGQWIR